MDLNTSRTIALQEEVRRLARTYKCDPQHLPLEALSPDLLAAGLHRLTRLPSLPDADSINQEAIFASLHHRLFPSLSPHFGQDPFQGAFLPTPDWTPALDEELFDRQISTQSPPLFTFSDQPRPGPMEAGPSKLPVTALPSPAPTE